MSSINIYFLLMIGLISTGIHGSDTVDDVYDKEYAHQFDNPIINHRDKRRLRNFGIALYRGDLNSVKYYGPKVASRCYHGGTSVNDPTLLRKARDNSANINEFISGFTPVSLASILGHTLALVTLLNDNADVNLAGFGKDNPSKNTPLHFAAAFGRFEAAAILIDAKANINAINAQGMTPLMLAALNGFERIVYLLINRGAEKDDQCDEGNTALALAAQHNHQDVIDVLLKHGARRDILNNASLSPYDQAKLSGHSEILSRLQISSLRRPVSFGSLKTGTGSPPPLDLTDLDAISDGQGPALPPSPGSGTRIREGRNKSYDSGSTPLGSGDSAPTFNWPISLTTVEE